MSDYFKDAEVNRLVRELNLGAVEDERTSAHLPSGREEVSGDERFGVLLAMMVKRGASDLHINAGSPPILRVDGDLTPVDQPSLDREEIRGMLMPFLTGRHLEKLQTDGSSDLSVSLASDADEGNRYRFRFNVHRNRDGLAAAVRALPTSVPTLRELALPDSLATLVEPRRGLVLVCGATGSGKTTTLAALVNSINQRFRRHVVTIEDPVEYQHRSERSLVKQVEVGRDAPGFGQALRAALRQDPDVILVGEMRDAETAVTALTAAETGHLILATLHTNDAAQSIHRIVDLFPSIQQSQIHRQLALCLNAILVQQLVPRRDGSGRVAAFELLIATHAVRNHIRKEQLHNLYNEMVLGRRQGMVTLEDSLSRLVRSGIIDLEEASVRASHPDELTSLVSG
jgi:twitching motility protein PilT